MHGAQERKFAACAGPNVTHSGLHVVNKLLIVLCLLVRMCRASVGWCFAKTSVDYAELHNVQLPCV